MIAAIQVWLARAWFVMLLAIVLLAMATFAGLRPTPKILYPADDSALRVRYYDRSGMVLNITYHNAWNIHDRVFLHRTPRLLQQAFLQAEDKRFYQHHGIDWWARLHALQQNLQAMRAVRGASTISEQVIRLLHPRPRNLWSRWLEGFEAMMLERRFSKAEILEFYLNQVPYARNQRGVVQAARFYFDRELDTLNEKEMLTLAVLVRAPGYLDLIKDRARIAPALKRLANYLKETGHLDNYSHKRVSSSSLVLRNSTLPVEAPHFVSYLRRIGNKHSARQGQVHTTLDGSLQKRVKGILDSRIAALKSRNVQHGAVLVVDHKTSEVLAWVNAGRYAADTPGNQIDAITTLRQPGSTLKPFVYAMALERGWTAATIIDDTPLLQEVGHGLHSIRNYSRHYYGKIRLRPALGNSLNIPAVRAVKFVGRGAFLQRLQNLGLKSLRQHPEFYGDGLALGNGEISLFELVQAYTVLARGGVFRPLRLHSDQSLMANARSRRVYNTEVVSIIAHILSDPAARQLEFSQGLTFRFPIQTAIKTGTSNDFRDAWAIGFNDRYTVGVWMGNMDRRPMREVNGSVGPGLVLRAVFTELNRHRQVRVLYLSSALEEHVVCQESGELATPHCPKVMEWFVPGHTPKKICQLHLRKDNKSTLSIMAKTEQTIRIAQPTQGLQLAKDPRIPDDHERFAFKLNNTAQVSRVEWIVNGKRVAIIGKHKKDYLWPVQRGQHVVYARVWLDKKDNPQQTEKISFLVK